MSLNKIVSNKLFVPEVNLRNRKNYQIEKRARYDDGNNEYFHFLKKYKADDIEYDSNDIQPNDKLFLEMINAMIKKAERELDELIKKKEELKKELNDLISEKQRYQEDESKTSYEKEKKNLEEDYAVFIDFDEKKKKEENEKWIYSIMYM